MIRELKRVILQVDLPGHGLLAGDIGTVVMIHDNGAGFEVEFMTLGGDTVAVHTLLASQVRSVKQKEIAHARKIAETGIL